jgi:hypothetical protein
MARPHFAASLAAHGAPLVLFGVHLCGHLASRAVELFNCEPRAAALVLLPCCLPLKMSPAFAIATGGPRRAGGGLAGPTRVHPRELYAAEQPYFAWVERLAQGVAAGASSHRLQLPMTPGSVRGSSTPRPAAAVGAGGAPRWTAANWTLAVGRGLVVAARCLQCAACGAARSAAPPCASRGPEPEAEPEPDLGTSGCVDCSRAAEAVC